MVLVNDDDMVESGSQIEGQPANTQIGVHALIIYWSIFGDRLANASDGLR